MLFSAILRDEAIQIGLFQRVDTTTPGIVGQEANRRFTALLTVYKLNIFEVSWYQLPKS